MPTMRPLPTLALPVALAGCLTAPTGLAPGDAALGSWPPPGASVAAVASGDVDGDGKDDLVVVDAAGDQVHLLRGGGDLDPTRATVTTSTRSVALAGLQAPAAALVARVAATRFVVVVDTPATGPRLTVFDPDLRQTGTVALPTPAPGGGAVLTLTGSNFGQSMSAVIGAAPTGVWFVEGDRLDDPAPMVVPVPQSTTPFTAVIAAGGYGAPAPTPRIFASEAGLTQRADAPGFGFSSIRTTGEWTAQALVDLTGDQLPDLVGFAPLGAASAELCLLDVQLAATPDCWTTPFGMDSASLAVGSVVSPGQTDIVLLDTPPAPAPAGLFVVPRLRLQGGALVADGNSAPGMFAVGGARLAIAQLDGGPAEILLVGGDGQIVCARASGTAAPARCAD